LPTLRSFSQLLIAAFQDFRLILSQALPIAGVLILVLFATDLAAVFAERLFHTQLAVLAVATLGTVANDWISAPYLVALYRLLLLQRLESPSLFNRSAATERFFAWSAVLTFVSAIPALLMILVPDPSPGPSGIQPPNLAADFGGIALTLMLTVLFTRLVTLLPATAIGMRPTFEDAMNQTKGHFWFIFAALLIVGVPFRLLLRSLQGEGYLAVIVMALVSVLPVLIGVCISSRIYLKLVPSPDTK
jgi:hypothetical protein